MILENYNDPEHPVITNDRDWAALLIADYHGEYPLEGDARVRILWDPFNIEWAFKILHGKEKEKIAERDTSVVDGITETLFGPLETKYNGYYDPRMNLWLLQGSKGQLTSVFDNLAQTLMGGPGGADDDTFDYWPNAFDMLVALAHDLIDLGVSSSWISGTVDRVVNSAIALQGPLVEWEAEEIAVQAASIKKRKEVA